MIITALGTGVAASNLPGIETRHPPGFWVEWGEHNEHGLLLEASEGIRFRLENIGVNYADIQHVAVSHSHADHNALPHFIQSVYCSGLWGGTQNTTINIYCPEQLANNFEQAWEFFFPELAGNLYDNFTVNFHSIPQQKTVVALPGDATLSGFEGHHGFSKTQNTLFRLETTQGVLAYSGDTGESDEIRDAAHEADIFICEASSQVGDEESATNYGHLSPFGAGVIARDARVKHLVLTHYTGLDSDEAMLEDCKRSEFDGEITIAKDSDTFAL